MRPSPTILVSTNGANRRLFRTSKVILASGLIHLKLATSSGMSPKRSFRLLSGRYGQILPTATSLLEKLMYTALCTAKLSKTLSQNGSQSSLSSAFGTNVLQAISLFHSTSRGGLGVQCAWHLVGVNPGGDLARPGGSTPSPTR